MTDLREELKRIVRTAIGDRQSARAQDKATDAILAAIDQHLTPYPALSKAWLHTMVDLIVSEERGAPGLTADQAKAEIDAAIAALPAPVVRVKELVWQWDENNQGWSADTPLFGPQSGYFVSKQDGQWGAAVDDGTRSGAEQDIGDFGPRGERAAKAACQADFARILSHVEPVSEGEITALRGVAEAARRVDEVEILQSRHGPNTHLNEAADAHAYLALALQTLAALKAEGRS